MDKVDWSRPIEAVHEDGRVRPADKCLRVGYEHSASWFDGDRHCSWEFYSDGLPWPGMNDWRIRNVATPAPKYPDALVERMVAAIRRWVACEGDAGNGHANTVAAEFRAIVAELPAEVNADEALAARIVDDAGTGLISREQRIAKVVGHLQGRRALEREHAGEGRG